MAQLFDIKKVVVGPRKLTATVVVAPSAPLRTVEDLEATTRVWQLMPQLRDHVCLGDAADNFGDVMGDTELAHLLEHVTVELLARTNIAGDITSGQTAEVGERTYEISLTCTDDVLVTGALSSAAWIMQWAFAGGGEPSPDVDAIAAGLVDLVSGLDDSPVSEESFAAAEQGGVVVDGEQDAVAGEAAEAADAAAEEPAAEELLAAEADPAAEQEVAPAEGAAIYEFNPQQVEVPVAEQEPVAEEAPAPAEPEPAPASTGAAEAAPSYVPACDYAPDPAANFVNEPAPAPAADPAPAQEPQTSTFGDWGMENIPRPRPVR